eukprot:TRINITY_DN1766_c0_g1_i2.p1 TRINITY_DN1766_c0_g1~~TRINITY_DN1766_c0_g1_i2.p1  ORF type:complete len:298 (+),score=36.42 TRINITY_DN1766_c0_g1_i2:28-894(+)
MGRKKRAQTKPVTAVSSQQLVKKVVQSKLAGKRSKRKHAIAIGYVHTLNKSLSQAKASGDHAEVLRIETELKAIGGIEAYQQSSLRSEQLGATNTSRWVVKQLKSYDLHDDNGRQLRFSTRERLDLLDVGALSANYDQEAKWLNTTAIDLNSQHPAVQQLDFFDLPQVNRYHIISLCLVINFVPSAEARGRMLLKCHEHLHDNGILAVMTPRACVDNSRYTNHDSFMQLLQDGGFHVDTHHMTRKLACYLCIKSRIRASKARAATSVKKVQLRKGGNRNNFVVLLPNS